MKLCLVCQSDQNIQHCSACGEATYCCQEHQIKHWNHSHKYLCKEGKYIRGTRIKTQGTKLAPNPIDPYLSFPRGRTGNTPDDPLQLFHLFKIDKTRQRKARMIKPGKLTPYVNRTLDGNPLYTEYPYEQKENQQVQLMNKKYRHIASFSLEELRMMQWDGAMYQGDTFKGVWVPFVDGYDSDPSHEYERFDINIAIEAGTAGVNDFNKYMMTAQLLVRLNNPTVGGKKKGRN